MADTTPCWYNYRTNTYDWLDFLPDDLSDYVPQTFQMQDFYRHRTPKENHNDRTVQIQTHI